MTVPPVEQAATVAWLVFLASWWSAASWVAKARTRPPLVRRIAYSAGFGIGFAALFLQRRISPDMPHGWSVPPIVDIVLLAAQVAAFAFAWWARVHLGRLWSGMLTLREGHRVVDTGPYRFVRHPIYTAFIGAAWAYALIEALPLSLVGAAVLTVVMTVKAGAEERLLRRELGAVAYDTYAARTPKLVPWPVHRR